MSSSPPPRPRPPSTSPVSSSCPCCCVYLTLLFPSLFRAWLYVCAGCPNPVPPIFNPTFPVKFSMILPFSALNPGGSIAFDSEFPERFIFAFLNKLMPCIYLYFFFCIFLLATFPCFLNISKFASMTLKRKYLNNFE